jgi:hypothetical protein
MTGSTRSSTIAGDSDEHRYREKSVDEVPGKKQSLLGVDGEDLTATGHGSASPFTADGKRELTEEDAWDKLGYSLPLWRKWSILVLILFIQTSMNSNASM